MAAIEGPAAGHFAASAEYGVAAVAAGIGGAVLGGLSQRGAGDSGGDSSNGYSTNPTGYSSGGSMGGSHFDPGPSTLAPMVFNFNGPILADGEEAKARIGGFVRDALEAAENGGPRLRGGR